MTSLLELPVEIRSMIAAFLSIRSLKVLRRVSRQACVMATPVLFHTISIGFSTPSLQALQDLIGSPIARHVRALQYYAHPFCENGTILPYRRVRDQQLTEFVTPEYCESHYDTAFEACFGVADVGLSSSAPGLSLPGQEIALMLNKAAREQRLLAGMQTDLLVLSNALSALRLRKLVVKFFAHDTPPSCLPVRHSSWDTTVKESFTYHLRTIIRALKWAEGIYSCHELEVHAPEDVYAALPSPDITGNAFGGLRKLCLFTCGDLLDSLAAKAVRMSELQTLELFSFKPLSIQSLETVCVLNARTLNALRLIDCDLPRSCPRRNRDEPVSMGTLQCFQSIGEKCSDRKSVV